MYIYGTNVGTGTRVTLNYDTLIVATGGVVASTDAAAVVSTTGDIFVSVAGTLAGADSAIVVGDDLTDSAAQIYVGTTGQVSGNYSVRGACAYLNLTNAGLIAADTTAIQVTLGISGARINNSGTIVGDIGISLTSADSVTIVNTGLIQGTSLAISLEGLGSDTVVNYGLVDGDVWLGDGNDTYIARNAGAVEGAIFGEAGNDVFRVGSAAEAIQGGVGTDTVIFDSDTGVRATLSGESSGGIALGDTYTNVERMVGTAAAADLLAGSAADNQLNGRGGNDSLIGGAGNDILTGGNGADQMWGGAGNDMFLFASAGEAGDAINDFGAAAGNNDTLWFSAAGFGAGLTTGWLAATSFWASTSGLAHDADDRFMLRTTDKTVWFDPDGSGAAARVLIADLQDNAVFGAGDILIGA